MNGMLNLYGSTQTAKLLAKGGVCTKGDFLDRRVGDKSVIAIRRRKAG